MEETLKSCQLSVIWYVLMGQKNLNWNILMCLQQFRKLFCNSQENWVFPVQPIFFNRNYENLARPSYSIFYTSLVYNLSHKIVEKKHKFKKKQKKQ